MPYLASSFTVAATCLRYWSATAWLNSCGSPGVPGVQILGWFGPARARFEALPLDPEAHHVETELLHPSRVGGTEVPRFARIRVGNVGRVLVHDVRAVHEHHAAVGVVDVGPARRGHEARDAVRRTLGRGSAAELVLDARPAQRLDVRAQRVEIWLVHDVLGRRGAGRRGRWTRRRGARRGRAWSSAVSMVVVVGSRSWR